MKNTITYFFALIFIIALSAEVMYCFSKKNNTGSVDCLTDIDTKGEGEESDKGDEKSDTLFHLFSCKNELAFPTSLLFTNAPFSTHFTSSDYSKIIYSPPEMFFTIGA